MKTPKSTKKFKLGPHQKAWIKLLTNTKRDQTTGQLYRPNDNAFCCLGIACLVAGLEPGDSNTKETFRGVDGSVPRKVREFFGLKTGYGGACGISGFLDLTSLNDDKGYSFKRIATVLKKNPEAYFKESK